MNEPKAPLEELVEALARYGRPHIMMHDDNSWSCSAKLRSNSTAGVFEVKSDFNKHKTLNTAVEECLALAIKEVAHFEFTPQVN